MIKNLSAVAAAVLTVLLVSPANVSARGFGGAHGGSAGHYSGSHQGSYSGSSNSGSHQGSYSGSHEGSYNGNHQGNYGGGAYGGNHEGSYNGGAASGYHPDAAAYGAGAYRNGVGAAYGAGAYGAGAYGANSGYYSALPSDEGVSQVVAPQTYVNPATGPVIIGGYPEGSGVVGGWGGNAPALRAAGNGINGDGFRGGADSFRGGGGFSGRGR
jgi:hypothetical protein